MNGIRQEEGFPGLALKESCKAEMPKSSSCLHRMLPGFALTACLTPLRHCSQRASNRCINRLAQSNSLARIASPAGMTKNAGPGRTRRAKPAARTSPPTIPTSTFLACCLITPNIAFRFPFSMLENSGGSIGEFNSNFCRPLGTRRQKSPVMAREVSVSGA
jgi:hypothetical protein